MLIKIKHSQLFSTDPCKRFSKEYNVPETMWIELWKRHKLLDYTISDLVDYFNIKTGRRIKRRNVERWLFLGEIYVVTKPARDKGAEVISTEIFGVLEGRVIEEITRHLKSGSTKDSRLMV